MAKKRKKQAPQERSANTGGMIGYLLSNDYDKMCTTEYVTLDQCPEIIAGVLRIAELIGSMTIHLMANTKNGDIRIRNELSRLIDIEPSPVMTRKTWMTYIVMDMLLYGKGNAVVQPHTWEGYIQSLEPIAPDRVMIQPRLNDRRYYDIYIDGVKRKPDNLLHFVYNPDKFYPFMGKGIEIPLRELAKTLKQARTTERGFMESKWKPSLIVKVDSNIRAFSSEEGRQKILNDYVKSATVGEPWLIPGEQFQV